MNKTFAASLAADALASPLSSPLSAPVVIDVGRTEAEDIADLTGFEAKSNPHPSGNAFLQATDDQASARATFAGATAIYDLTVGYFDEIDGVSSLEVVIDGIVVDAFDWDGTFGDVFATPAGRAERAIEDLRIDAGAVIELRGMRDGGEPLRIDYVDVDFVGPVVVTPPPTASFTVEAESFDIVSGFAVVSNPNASGGQFLVDTGSGNAAAPEARAGYTVTQGGTFDLTLGYFDETDGVSSLRVLVNGQEIDSFDWDGTDGTALADPESRAERTVEDVTLAVGDRIELVGRGDGTEPLRTDFLRFDEVEATVTPPATGPSPDFWFIDDGEVVVALNDGTGDFTTKATGIVPGDAAVALGDIDADGDPDFLVAETAGYDAVTELATITVSTYANGGNGGFALASTEDLTIDAFNEPLFVFAALADLTGDGAADLLLHVDNDTDASSYSGNGDGTFAPLQDDIVSRSEGFFEAVFADFDGDGNVDAGFVPARPDVGISILLNDGSGMLETNETEFFPQREFIFQTKVIDLEGDGDIDIVYVDPTEASGIVAITNDGTGRRERSEDTLISLNGDGGDSVGAIEVGNFDGDPTIEIVASSLFSDPDTDTGFDQGFRVFEVVSGDDGFELVEQSFIPQAPIDVFGAADYDLDGDLDLLASGSFGGGEIRLLRNDGTATFADAGVAVALDGQFARFGDVAFFDDNALMA